MFTNNTRTMTIKLSTGLTALSLLTAMGEAKHLSRRGTIASDEIVGFDQTVPSGTTSDVYLAYQPYLYVVVIPTSPFKLP